MVFESLEDLRRAASTDLGYSEWVDVDQARQDAFAEATGSRQWIHEDTDRARRGPFGGPIADGYLTLSLSNLLLPQLLDVRDASAGVNYGTGRVRFPAPLPLPSRVRAAAQLVAVDDVPGGVQTTVRITLEAEGAEKPVCIIESLSRWVA